MYVAVYGRAGNERPLVSSSEGPRDNTEVKALPYRFIALVAAAADIPCVCVCVCVFLRRLDQSTNRRPVLCPATTVCSHCQQL